MISVQQPPRRRRRFSPSLSLHRCPPTGVQVQELADDDMSYDADVEVLQPDEYEDVDEETDEEQSRDTHHLNAPEDQLAARLKKLYCGEEQKENPDSPGAARSRKRMSKEMQGDDFHSFSHGFRSPMEVTELVTDGPPAKRQHREVWSTLNGEIQAESLANSPTCGTPIWAGDVMNYESSNSIIESATESSNLAPRRDSDAMSTG